MFVKGGQSPPPLLYNGSVQAAGGGLTPTQIWGTEKPEARGGHRKQPVLKLYYQNTYRQQTVI